MMLRSATFFVCVVAWLSSEAAIRKTRLTFVNGIGYALSHVLLEEKAISKLFGGEKVEYCHNPTAMTHEGDTVGYLGDLTQAGTQKLGRNTAEVGALVQHLKAAVNFVGKRGRVIHIAHSQGALLTFLAAKQLTPSEMSQMEIVTFGGAASLHKTSDTPFHRCINYYSINDPLLFLVPSADQALRSGYVANEEFCFLAPRAGDPIADHSLLGATYSQALYWEGQRFQRKYRSVAFRVCRSVILLVLAIINTFVIRLKAVVRATVLPILVVFVHLCAQHQRSLSPLLAQAFALYAELYQSLLNLATLLALRYKIGRPENVLIPA